jgi:AmmeMemoRadiSam system protein A
MCFVTWKRDGRLRGCIGSVEPVRPLFVDAEGNSVQALLRDPRFPPATAKEFPRYRAEISVLSPFVAAQDPVSAVVIGVHGLLVEKGKRIGLLLPQVAVEWKWDVETFLRQACLKAGLPEEAWREGSPPATVYTFSAEVFGEPL